MSRNVRIGAGAGFAGNRIEPAVDLAVSGRLDFLVRVPGRTHDRPGPLSSATRSECWLRSASGGPDALDGGVTRSLSLDAHGKTPGMQLLDLELEKG
jgi:hypothetical protein